MEHLQIAYDLLVIMIAEGAALSIIFERWQGNIQLEMWVKNAHFVALAYELL